MLRMMRRSWLLVLLLVLALVLIPFRGQVRGLVRQLMGQGRQKTIAKQVAAYGPAARQRMQPFFAQAGVPYPPRRVVLVGIKDEDILEVDAAGANGILHVIHRYPILAASGSLGPKQREGDLQVPEGLYRIDWLHPNSLYHLALHVNYPNAFDRQMARRDHRANLGGDIMIHGSNASIGCLAMGDAVAEELFVLAADTRLDHLSVMLTPTDFRRPGAHNTVPSWPPWTTDLYRALRLAMATLPRPAP